MYHLLKKKIDSFFTHLHDKFQIDIKEDWEIYNKPKIHFCIYEFVKGKNKGSACGLKIKKGDYCSKHTKKSTKKIEEKKEEKKEIEEIKKEEKKEIVDIKNIKIYLNKKLGKFIHNDTRLAFFSKEIKIIYGKLSCFEDRIVPLCDKDIDLCKKYHFKYDTNLYKQSI